MRIAFMMHGIIEDQRALEAYTRKHLALKQRSSIDPRQLLREIAQWYGVLVPTPDDKWQFSHRSIHDYLAARFWVESNQYAPSKVRVWNSRAAYAACLSHDATDSIIKMLELSPNLHGFTECLYNDAPFETHAIALAVTARFRRQRPFTYQRAARRITVETSQDFFPLVSMDFLLKLLETAANGAMDSDHVIAAYCIAELKRRNARIEPGWLMAKLKEVYPSLDFVFQIGILEPTVVTLKQVLMGC
jgi:hypothetical protein